MENLIRYKELSQRDDFEDILENRRNSSDIRYALRSFTPVLYKGVMPCSAGMLKTAVLQSQCLHFVIQQMSAETGESPAIIQEEAAVILEEMAQNLQLGFIRFLAYSLSKVFKRVFRRVRVNEEGIQRLQQAIQEYPVVLLPNHKSYIDFLVLSYILFTYDLPLPVIAAGIPLLGMKFFGEILRRSGAFYIRRSIGGDKLYWAVLSEYVKTIIRKGFAPVLFFVEGMRSRTVKSMRPKLGLVDMVMDPFFKGEVYDVSLVPISISYERVLEESLLAYELLGTPKPRESTSGLLKARKVLSEDFGTMHVYFGHPLSLRHLSKGRINRCHFNLLPRDLPRMPSEDTQVFVNETAHRIVHLQEEKQVLSPWFLIATILMQNLRGIEFSLLIEKTVWLGNLVQTFGAVLDWPDCVPASEIVSSSITLHKNIVHNMGGQIVLTEEPQREASPEEGVFQHAVTVLMCASYRNQALHVFVRPMLIAVALHTVASSRKEEVFRFFRFLQVVFANEFIFIPGRTVQDFEEGCHSLIKCGSIQVINQDITVTKNGHKILSFLEAIMEPFIQGYQVVCRYLIEENVEDFIENRYVSAVRGFAAQRILSGSLESYEVLSSDMQRNALAGLIMFNAVKKSKTTEQTNFKVNKAAVKKLEDMLVGRLPLPKDSFSRL
nr:PREDICTED: dihydroxyacetone phosphate acyltransferase-like [Lepisosteus oculatus]